METIAPVVIGALLTFVGGVLGAAIQGRREHRKWLREKRHDGLVELRRVFGELDHVDREQELAGMTGDHAAITRQIERRAELNADLRASIAELYIAPKSVRSAAAWFALQRGQTHDPKQRQDAERSLEDAMRKTLGVRD